MNSKQYRDFYESKTNKKIPSGFDVHHIDQNRSNNDITNLVAIPRIVHQKYHNTFSQYISSLENLNVNVHSNPMSYDYCIYMITQHSKCCTLIHYFILIRDALIIGNIRSIFSHSYETDFSHLINELE